MLIGHKKIWKFIEKSNEIDRLPHAFLFSGQVKLGKKKLAFELVKLLNSEDKEFNLEKSPDLILIEPENKEIQISQIRDLIKKLSFKPYSSPFKIAIIDRAHLMNEHAQSCLLKTLEEPKGKTIIILITEYPSVLFSTIVSRTQVIKFYPVSNEEIEKYLHDKDVKPAEIKKIIEFSMGKPGLAIDLIKNKKELDFYKDKIEELEKILDSDLYSKFDYIKKMSKEDFQIKKILDIWLNYFRDALLDKFKKGNSNIINYSLIKLRNIIKKINKTKLLLSTTNVNAKLLLEVLVLEF